VRGEKIGSFDEKFDDRIYSHTLATTVLDAKGEVLFDAILLLIYQYLKH